jgi:hypothetical protein
VNAIFASKTLGSLSGALALLFSIGLIITLLIVVAAEKELIVVAMLLTCPLAFLFFGSVKSATYMQAQVLMMVIVVAALVALNVMSERKMEYVLCIASTSAGLSLPLLFSSKKRNLTVYSRFFSVAYACFLIIVLLVIGRLG